jgi:hypothetical protein
MTPQTLLRAAIVEALRTTDDLASHQALRELVQGWARRLAGTGASSEAAISEIADYASPIVLEASHGIPNAAERADQLRELIARWVLSVYPGGRRPG